MLDAQALSALAAVLRAGSFERAARLLHVTPSAVSQRIRQLEDRLGCVLLVRSSPVVATAEGQQLYRHFQQLELLEDELAQALPRAAGPAAAGRAPLAVALNADSLASWALPALAAFQQQDGGTLAVQVDDQDHTREWLQAGAVLAAVSSSGQPVAGCRVDALGRMAYVATASPDFVARHFGGRRPGELPQAERAAALMAAPMLVFNAKDVLQARCLAELLLPGQPEPQPPRWHLPSTQAFAEAALRGLGWGLQPQAMVRAELATGRLLDLCPGQHIEVPLYWLSWRLASRRLGLLRDCVVAAARDGLLAPA